MPLQFALRLICHHLEHSFSAGCHKYTVSMRACLHPSLIMLLERSNWCLKAQPLWKHLGWHRGILLFSLFPTLISQDFCCWLCLEPDCLKFLKLSQLENLSRRDAESHFQGYEHFHWYIGFYPRGKGVPQGFKNATASRLHEDATACNHSLCFHDSAVMSCQGYSTNEDPSRCSP